MKVYINEINGIADAIASMFFSKRTWTKELDNEIRNIVETCTDRHGKIPDAILNGIMMKYEFSRYNEWMDKLLKWGTTHITMLRYIDFSITVEGLHRAGQDDWDSHAWRFNNRIIRNSTTRDDFDYEISDWYKDKIIPTDIALAELGISTPDKIEHDGATYIKTINGYIREDYKDNRHVRRGLYMLSIPSDFIFRINLTEWAHVYKERNEKGGANPEVKICCEAIADQLAEFQPKFTRELFRDIKN